MDPGVQCVTWIHVHGISMHMIRDKDTGYLPEFIGSGAYYELHGMRLHGPSMRLCMSFGPSCPLNLNLTPLIDISLNLNTIELSEAVG